MTTETLAPLFTKEQLFNTIAMPEVQGIEDLDDIIQDTSHDIERILRTEWWVDENRANFGLSTEHSIHFQYDLVNQAQLKNAAIYYAIFQYILPRMTRFTEGDVTMNKMKYYKNKWDIEIAYVKNNLIYDWNRDGNFEETEREIRGRRLTL